ncbi:mitochondrial protein C2orf69 homolog isoform X2 [Diorhabda sublineata]|uniref:mitochondrial protein C2orf69 homolog isoform X2 n=1 Tax=Diorhabda sublineata TaxID=1163346 RepID=UPI0024E10A5D|nr:mitochondrial protein C2orf69 homolog isoform X2 [Diorhabda sublineata]XP_056637266.1 mitochondrial protein C2orf69 homolog isoform X2 [Diorhabda sublineata]
MSKQFLPNIIRLSEILGYENRCNDVVYCRPSIILEKPSLCVFFGGDIQDFTENMLSHRDNKNYVEWNLENTSKLLQSSFADSHIIVIRPARMEYKSFSCYENFLPCSKCGVPNHTFIHHGLEHLELIIQNVSRALRTMSNEDFNNAVEVSTNGLVLDSEEEVEVPKNIPFRDTLNFDDCDVTLIGFSKGCTVLNQFLYEFHHYKSDDKNEPNILKRIKTMYWLDGGHSGGKNTWITSLPLLKTFSTMGISIYVHVSPYQVADIRRPWIKYEEKHFTDALKKFGANINRTIHFVDVPSSVQTHFNVLKVFREINKDT